jgi:transcriptional regulator with XRE-family HTH domain
MARAITEIMGEAGIGLEDLVRLSGLDSRTVRAIANAQYTPSPGQRDRLAAALGVGKDAIAWGHTVPVEHLRGNGPQFGRST